MTPAQLALLGALRIAVGGAVLARPAPLLPQLLGADRGSSTRVDWVARMFAGREIALGLGTLMTRRDAVAVRPWLLAQALSDAVDAMALVVALRERKVRALPAGLTVVAAAAGAAAELAAARR